MRKTISNGWQPSQLLRLNFVVALLFTSLGFSFAPGNFVQASTLLPPTRQPVQQPQPQVIPSAGTLQFERANYSATEGAGPAVITVTRTGGSTGVVSALISLTDVTTSPADYVYPQAGTLDTTFADTGMTDTIVSAIAVQPDGKIVAGSYLDAVNYPYNTASPELRRYNPDGSQDLSFTSYVYTLHSLALQPDGKIIAGGEFTVVGGQNRAGVARLNPDGSLDTTFADPAFTYQVYAVALQPDGKVLVGGAFTNFSSPGANHNYLARFNSNGTLDTTFKNPLLNDAVYALALQPDGKVLAGGRFTSAGNQTRNRLARFNADGTLDTTFADPGFNSYVNCLALQSDGRILAGGGFTLAGTQTQNRLARINSDGTLDTGFQNPGLNSAVNSVAVQSDGQILAGGSFITASNQTRNRLARFNPDGSLDNSFANPGLDNSVVSMALQPNGQILIGGAFLGNGQLSRKRLARVNYGALQVSWADGDSNPKTVSLPIVDDQLVENTETLNLSLTSLQGGAVVGTLPTATLAIRDNEPGQIQLSVGNNQTAPVNTFFGTALQAQVTTLAGDPLSNKTVVFSTPTGGASGLFAGATSVYTTNSFTDGLARTPALKANNIPGPYSVTAVVSGTAISSSFTLTNTPATANLQFSSPVYTVTEGAGSAVVTLTRSGASSGALSTTVVLTDVTTSPADYVYPAAGTLDNSFPNLGFDKPIQKVVVQPDDKLLVAGGFTTTLGQQHKYLVRLNPNGTLDSGFHDPVINDSVYDLALQPDGKIVIAGQFTSVGGQPRHYMARLNSDGSLDTSFVDPGLANSIFRVAVQWDGRVLGLFYYYNLNGQPITQPLIRLNSDGTTDTTFQYPTFSQAGVIAVGVQLDGKILVGGQFSTVNGQNYQGLVRLNNDGSLDNSFHNPGFSAGVRTFTIESDNKILIGGYFSFSPFQQNYYSVARLNADGTLDTSFQNTNLNTTINALAIQPDGKILAGGSFNSIGGQTYDHLARFNSSGTLDTSFKNPGFNYMVIDIGFQSDGKIIASDVFTNGNGYTSNFLVRLSSNAGWTVNWGDGDNNPKTISLPIVDDKLVEGTETLMLGLTDLQGGANLGTMPTATLAILDNESVLSLSNSANPASYGQPVTFTATISPSDATGLVTFTVDSAAPVTATVVAGSAVYSTNSLSLGSHIITATYGGDNIYTAGPTATLTQTITQAAPTVTLTSNPNPALIGQTITFTASVPGLGASGSVTFSEGSALLGTASLVQGSAVITRNDLSAGTHVITATYSGDTNYLPGSSAPLTQLVVVCNPFVVTAATDNGTGDTCGTLSYALAQPITGTNPVTVTFALTQGKTITLTGALVPTVKAGLALDGGVCGSPRLAIYGGGITGDGLRLAGNNFLRNLYVYGFKGRALVTLGQNNHIQCSAFSSK